ncbi:hypothetical protein [Streptomyces sp. NPDC058011]|uniref:hypothetical protein n=1 Tax=Streptomyces sp. NPDC058011 TaxID=3346305 RepID=UPI0036E9227C
MRPYSSLRARRMHAPGGGDLHDAPDLITLSSRAYHYARWHGVLQAVRAGATDGQIAIALGMSMPDTRDSSTGYARATASSPGSSGRTRDSRPVVITAALRADRAG